MIYRAASPLGLCLLLFPAVDLEQSVMIFVAKAAEVVQRNHLEVSTRQCMRKVLPNRM